MVRAPEAGPPGSRIIATPQLQLARHVVTDVTSHKEVLTRVDAERFGWVTSHSFRRTVATRFDDAGLSVRTIADHLGHAKAVHDAGSHTTGVRGRSPRIGGPGVVPRAE